MTKKRSLIRRPTSRPPNEPGDFTVEVLGRRYPVIDMADASKKVETMIAMSGMGASQIGAEFAIRDGELVIGHVSYNGKVWKSPPGTWLEGEQPVYTPSYEPVPSDRIPPAMKPKYPSRSTHLPKVTRSWIVVVDEEGRPMAQFQNMDEANSFCDDHNRLRDANEMEYRVKGSRR